MTRIASWNSARDVWETEAVSLLSGRLDVFSETFPISGSMRNGAVYGLPMSAPRMDGSGSLFSQLGGKLLTTPTTTQRGTDANLDTREGARSNLHNEIVNLLPTPAAGNPNDGENTDGWLARRERVKATGVNGNGMGMPLTIAVQLLPTPRSNEANGIGVHGDGGNDLRTTVALLPTPKAGDADFGMPRTSGRPPEKSTHLMTRMEYTKPADTWGPYAAAIQRWEAALGRPAPDPTELGPKGGRRLASAFVEWLMGLPPGWVTSHGQPRTAELKMLGNGVVTQQAVAALRSIIH